MSTEAHNEETEGTETDKVNTGALGTLVAVGLFAMITICAAVTALVRHDIDAEQAEKDVDANDTVVALKASQRGVLNGPASYLDRAKGLVSLPIETAKQVVVAELQRDPASATPPQPAASAETPAASGSAAAAPADSAKKPEETPKSANDKKGAGAKTETVKDKAPQGNPAPASPPLSPTAASPGALSPGPLKN
jgi:hypothetical protein